jgi:hypothetical protein
MFMAQLYQYPPPPHPPLMIKNEEKTSFDRALRVLDKLPFRETHKIGKGSCGGPVSVWHSLLANFLASAFPRNGNYKRASV